MRKLIPVLALSMLMAGCGAAGGGAPDTFAQAVDAYVAGDRTALHEAGESARALKIKIPDGSVPAIVCEKLTPAERREVFPAFIIEMLDKPTLMSMSEPARYLYFRSISKRFEGVKDMVTSVDSNCGGALGAVSDISTLTAMRKVVLSREETWRHKLETEYGAQLTPRLDEARKLLSRNGYSIPGGYSGD
jgi:hypothetical protein